jgi:hypothetical protein
MGIKTGITDFLKIETFKENIFTLVEAKYELKKLDIQEKLASILVNLLLKIILGVVWLMVYIIGLVWILLAINQYTHTTWLGPVFLLGFHGLLAAGLYLNKKRLIATFETLIHKEMNKTGL